MLKEDFSIVSVLQWVDFVRIMCVNMFRVSVSDIAVCRDLSAGDFVCGPRGII